MSILIGYLQHRDDPNRVWKTYSFASFSKMEGCEFVYFTPQHIQIRNRMIKGKVYSKGSWIDKNTRLPDVIYYEHDPMNKGLSDAIHQLKELVPFTSLPINSSKLLLFHKLKAYKVFADYVIPYDKADKERLLDFMNEHGTIALKPNEGKRGNTLFVHQDKNRYIVELDGDQKTFSREQFIHWITGMMDQEDYLMQKYIPCKTKDGDLFDFRLHTQKNGSGKWISRTVPRVAQNGAMYTKISSGGLTGILTYFLKKEFGNERYNIERILNRFGVSLCEHLEEIQNTSFDELGIDVGVDENKKIWIYDISWKPSEPPFESDTIETIKNAVRYAVYLAKQNQMAT